MMRNVRFKNFIQHSVEIMDELVLLIGCVCVEFMFTRVIWCSVNGKGIERLME